MSEIIPQKKLLKKHEFTLVLASMNGEISRVEEYLKVQQSKIDRDFGFEGFLKTGIQNIIIARGKLMSLYDDIVE